MPESLRTRLYRTDAIVLQVRDLGEADRILIVFTELQGKTSVIAKGARRSTSKLGSHLDHFAVVTLNLARGRDLDTVTGVATLDPHANLGTDLDAFGYAAHCAELVRDLTQEHQEHPGVFELLRSSLALLDQGVPPWHVARHFELRILIALGYQPELFACAGCQREIDAVANHFSPQLGGMVCRECARGDRDALELSVNAQKYLRALVRDGLARVVGLRLTPVERGQVETAMLRYLQYTGERDFSSLRVLGAMHTGFAAPS